MPEISRFLGVAVAMFYADHPPPHFHVRYGEHRAIMDIEHKQGLRENWRRARRLAQLEPIPPLE